MARSQIDYQHPVSRRDLTHIQDCERYPRNDIILKIN